MRAKDRDRTAPRAWNVLRAAAAATLVLSAAVAAADGPAPANAVNRVSGASTPTPAVHDSVHPAARSASPAPAASATSPDEPPSPAPAVTVAKPAAKPVTRTVAPAPVAPVAKSPSVSARPAVSPAVPAPAAQAWHPPLAPPTQGAGTKPVVAPVAGVKPAPTPVTAVAATRAPAPVPGSGPKTAPPSVAAPVPVRTDMTVKPVTPTMPATPVRVNPVPGQPARTTAPVAPPTAPASGHANMVARPGVPVASTVAAPNPFFIGPPAPGSLVVKTPNPAQPAGAGAVTASSQAMSVTMKPVAGPSISHLDEHLTYQYNALGRRDPFQPLIGGAYVGADEGGTALPDLGGIKVVGIVWGTDDQFAMVEDSRGQSMVLRRGDKVMNGVVESLKRDGMVVNLTVDGQSQSVVIPLTKKGDR